MRSPGMSMQVPGLSGSTVVPYPYETDWSRIAQLIVHDSLKVEGGERVLIQCDPTYFPELTEQIRIELVRAGAYEVAAMEFYPPGLFAERRRRGWRETPRHREAEDKLARVLFDVSDVYIWLPRAWQGNFGQTEEILRTWPGRSLHFHWVPMYVDPAVFRAQSQQLERSLFIDYGALTDRQRRLADLLRGAEIRITNAAGTDVTVQIADDAYISTDNGDASRAWMEANARPGVARDRERELPCGLVSSTHVATGEGRMVFANGAFVDRLVGRMEVTLKDGKMTSLTTERHNAWLQAQLALETGDWDALAGIAFGTNPELGMLPGISEVPYWGSGAGLVRLMIGDNIESGGGHQSSFHLGHYLTDATVTANGTPILTDGRLVIE